MSFWERAGVELGVGIDVGKSSSAQAADIEDMMSEEVCHVRARQLTEELAILRIILIPLTGIEIAIRMQSCAHELALNSYGFKTRTGPGF